MKNSDNERLLERQRVIDRERRAQAILKAQRERRDASRPHVSAMARMAGAPVRKAVTA